MGKNISPIWKAYQGIIKKPGMYIVKGKKKEDPLAYLERYLDRRLRILSNDYKRAKRFYKTKARPDILNMCDILIRDIELLLKNRLKK
jgi:hypothetical protein